MVKFIGFVHNTGKFTPSDGDQKGHEIEFDNYLLNMINDDDPLLHGFQPQLPVKVKTDNLIKLLQCRRDEIEDILTDHIDGEIILATTEKIKPEGGYTRVLTRIYFP